VEVKEKAGKARKLLTVQNNSKHTEYFVQFPYTGCQGKKRVASYH
jgi:hypothetical protein